MQFKTVHFHFPRRMTIISRPILLLLTRKEVRVELGSGRGNRILFFSFFLYRRRSHEPVVRYLSPFKFTNPTRDFFASSSFAEISRWNHHRHIRKVFWGSVVNKCRDDVSLRLGRGMDHHHTSLVEMWRPFNTVSLFELFAKAHQVLAPHQTTKHSCVLHIRV